LKLTCDEPLSNVAFNFNLRRYNPVQEGGGRKGLPKSFLNRFTRVHVEVSCRPPFEFGVDFDFARDLPECLLDSLARAHEHAHTTARHRGGRR
jgi:hypothetical protein